MTSETVSPGSSRLVGTPVSINAPQTFEQVIARCEGRVTRLTAKLSRQVDRGASEEAIAATKEAIKAWTRKMRGTRILAGEDE